MEYKTALVVQRMNEYVCWLLLYHQLLVEVALRVAEDRMEGERPVGKPAIEIEESNE